MDDANMALVEEILTKHTQAGFKGTLQYQLQVVTVLRVTVCNTARASVLRWAQLQYYFTITV